MVSVTQKPVIFPAWRAAFFGIRVDQNDVRADPPDAAPGDQKIVVPTQRSEELTGGRHDNGGYFPGRNLDHHIGYKAQPPPVTDADHFFALQLCKSDRHTNPLLRASVCARGRGYVCF